MKRLAIYIFFGLSLCGVFLMTGCANKRSEEPVPEPMIPPGISTEDPESGQDLTDASRLVIKGCVTDEEANALSGIRVDVYGIRNEMEKDIFSYNYTYTDSLGNYLISRYLERNTSIKAAVFVATDGTGTYQEQTVFMTDDIPYSKDKDKLTVTVNFILTKN